MNVEFATEAMRNLESNECANEVPPKTSRRNIARRGPVKATGQEAVKGHTRRKKRSIRNNGETNGKAKVVQKSETSNITKGTAGDLSVVIYHRAELGSARHWSLFYRTDGQRGTISEAAGPLGHFLYQEIRNYEVKIQENGLHEQEIPVAFIPSYARYLGNVSETPMHNKSSDWNCQNWVLEALEGLHLERILDDDEYQDASDRLRLLMG
jgi:hypothetical protein